MNPQEKVYDIIRKNVKKRFAVVFTHKLIWDDITDFTDYKYGVVYVTPSVSKDNVPCYVIILINRDTRTIYCGNTRGDVLSCEAFHALSMLEDNGKYFTCMQFRISRDYYESIGEKFDTEEEFLEQLLQNFGDLYCINYHDAVYKDKSHYEGLGFSDEFQIKYSPYDIQNY